MQVEGEERVGNDCSHTRSWRRKECTDTTIHCCTSFYESASKRMSFGLFFVSSKIHKIKLQDICEVILFVPRCSGLFVLKSSFSANSICIDFDSQGGL